MAQGNRLASETDREFPKKRKDKCWVRCRRSLKIHVGITVRWSLSPGSPGRVFLEQSSTPWLPAGTPAPPPHESKQNRHIGGVAAQVFHGTGNRLSLPYVSGSSGPFQLDILSFGKWPFGSGLPRVPQLICGHFQASLWMECFLFLSVTCIYADIQMCLLVYFF